VRFDERDDRIVVNVLYRVTEKPLDLSPLYEITATLYTPVGTRIVVDGSFWREGSGSPTLTCRNPNPPTRTRRSTAIPTAKPVDAEPTTTPTAD
jgi:hypothetical protein